MQSNYPAVINEFVSHLVDGLLESTDFFEEYSIDKTRGAETAKSILEPLVLSYWIENGEVGIADDTMETALKTVIADCLLQSLTEKGYIGNVEDGGESHFFLTEKGKEITQGL
jgi:predicted transcriptional regulator